MSTLQLMSIYDLLGKNFFIPSYQRGYRWNKRQIEDLLEDLYNFSSPDISIDKGDFYCLQPIVVKKCDEYTIEFNNLESDLDNNTWYEVIDGQQRLTSVYLLLKYLVEKDNIDLQSDYGKKLYKISYQTHEDDNNYIINPSEFCDKSPNAFYITNAFNYISNWFELLDETKGISQKKTIRNRFMTLLTSTRENHENNYGYVQVIWYESDDPDPIKTFIRLNIGKIPLRNAELIKALFLQKRDKSDISQIQQIQIAKEWDQIEATLQDKRMWAFLNKDVPNLPAHIEFLFNVIFDVDGRKEIIELGNKEYIKVHEGNEPTKEKELKERDDLGAKKFADKYGLDEYASFRFFSERLKKADRETIEKEWSVVKDYYETFNEWYHNPLWYHYIGFLIYCGKPVTEIYDVYYGKNKNDFEKSLIEEIKKIINIQYKAIDNDNGELFFNGDPIVYSNKSKPVLKRLLMLYNIEYILQKHKGESLGYILFPFDLFKTEKWDIEHIDSFTTNPLTDLEQQKIWLKTALDDLKEYGIDYSKTEKITENDVVLINSFLNDLRSKVSFDEIKLVVSKLSGEYLPSEEVKKDIKNSIGNLTLLNADINRGYGNAIFPSKKKEIIKKDAEGRFIPICTKNVFLKSFLGVNNTSISWSEYDMTKYRNSMIKVIKKFVSEVSESGDKNG